MQIINLEADISTPHLEVEMRTLRIGSGGTDNYPDLNNKPSINGTTLVGDILTANLGIKTSELTNDSGYITTADIPTKTSDLINDSDFTTGSALTAAIAAVSADIPTATSQLTNDSGFLTSIDIPVVPTKTSDLVNDSGYITAADAPVTTVNGLTGDVVIDAANADYDLNNTIKDKIDALEAAIPTDTNDLTNGAGYITAAEAPVQSVNNQTGDVTLSIPTDTNDLTNGAGYITAAEAPVQSVNGQTGTVSIKATDLAGPGVDTDEVLNAGSSVILTTAAEDLDVIYLNAKISPIQASGTPTPSNPLPITGLTDVVIDITDSDSNVHNYTIALGQTVYGGTLNVTTGELTINRAYVDLGSLTWNKVTSFANILFLATVPGKAANNSNVNCSNYNNVGIATGGTFLNNMANNSIASDTTTGIYIRDDANASLSAADFKTAMSGVDFVYEIATPTTVTLTPTEMQTYATQCEIQLTDCEIASLKFFTEGSEFLVPQVKTILKAYNLL